MRDIQPSVDHRVQIATLDADPDALSDDIMFSLGCINGLRVGYLSPYSFEVPDGIDTVAFYIGNSATGAFTDGGTWSAEITDDGSSMFLTKQGEFTRDC